MMIFNKQYSDESLIDLQDDIEWEIEHSGIEKNEDGFRPGTFTVIIEWKPE
jgi:hypothetical protein